MSNTDQGYYQTLTEVGAAVAFAVPVSLAAMHIRAIMNVMASLVFALGAFGLGIVFMIYLTHKLEKDHPTNLCPRKDIS